MKPLSAFAAEWHSVTFYDGDKRPRAEVICHQSELGAVKTISKPRGWRYKVVPYDGLHWDNEKLYATRFDNTAEELARLPDAYTEALDKSRRRPPFPLREGVPMHYYRAHPWRFCLEPGDIFTSYVNGGERDTKVLAIADKEALVEYQMPGGTSTLYRLPIYEAYSKSATHKQIAKSKKWVRAIREAGQDWIGVPQQNQGERVPLPSLEELERAA